MKSHFNTINLPIKLALFVFLLTGAQLIYAQSATQTVRGRILDSESKQPIIGANVIITNQAGKGAATDAEGEFKIQGVALGRITLKITYIGYEPLQVSDIMVTAGKEVVLNLLMSESLQKLNEVVISYDRKNDPTVTNNEMAVVSSRSFNPSETNKYAGALGDPSRMAANYAGVVAGNDSRNDIVVRGNSPNALLWQLQGLNIPNPNHFGAGFNTGGPVSMLNSNNIAKSDFFTSAFPAMYGNANGAAFDLQLRDGNNQKREFMTQVGFNGFEFGAEGPFSASSKASFVVNYRYSTLGLLKDIGINPGTGAATPLYQDLNMKVVIPTKGNGKFTIFGLGGISSIDLLGSEVDTTEVDYYGSPDENTRPRYHTIIGGVSYEKSLSAKTWARFTLGATQIFSKYTSERVVQPDKSTYLIGKGSFTDNKYSAVYNMTHKFDAKRSLHFGVNNDFSTFDYINKDYYNFGTTDSTRVDRKGNFNLAQGYLQLKYRLTTRLTSMIGVHAQHMNINKQFVVEPRVGLRYSVSAKSTFNLGYGLHHQNMPTYNIFVQNSQGQETNRGVKFTRSNHFVGGFESNITPLLKLKIEAYYQIIDKAPVDPFASSFSMLNIGADFVPSDRPNLVNNGTGNNYGIELTIERFFGKGYYYLITGSVFDSKYKGSDKIERNTAFNTGYAANFLAGKEFSLNRKGSVIYFNAKVTSVGGRFFTPIDAAASQAAGTAVYDESKAYSESQPDYFRADIKFGYRKDFKTSSLEFAVDLLNITNHQNVFAQGYNANTNTVSYEYQQGFFPVPMVKFTF